MRRHEGSTRSRSIRPMLPRFWRHALLMLATALLAVAAASDSIAQPTCTITWDGGAAPASNSWHDAANWTGDVLPGPTDHVCIPANTTVEVSQDAGSVLTVQSQGTLAISGGSLTLTDTTETSTTATLTQSNGTIGGTGTLTVSGSFAWSGGTQTDAGNTTIASTATLTISADVQLLGGRTLQNNGTVNWTGGIIDSGQASVIENAGTFDASGDNVMRDGSVVVGALHVHNTGIFRKSAGTGTTTIAVPFDNDGTVSAGAGTLSFTGGDDGATEIGSFGGTGPGIVSFDTGIYGLGNGASFTGRVTITGATVNVTGNVSATSAATLTQSNGTIGGTGTLTVSGSFAWSGGTQTDAGNTTIASTATLTISADVQLLGGRTLQNNGTVNWTGGIIDSGQASVIENAGTFDASGDNVMRDGSVVVGALHVHNTGIFRKSAGTGTTSISAGSKTTAPSAPMRER